MTLLMMALFFALPANEQGVKVVENPIQPTGKAQTITFEKEWSVGPDRSEDHYIWSGAATVAIINKDAHIFILDPGSHRIVELDEKGDFVRQIGKRGEGPGEFRILTNMSPLSDGGFVVHEYLLGSTFISFFDAQGNFTDRHSLAQTKKPMLSSQFSPNGKYVSATYFKGGADDTVLQMRQEILNKDYTTLIDFGSKKVPNIEPSRIQEPAWWTDFLAPWFKLIPRQRIVTFGPDGKMFTASGDKYQITRYNAEMKPELKFGRKYKPRVQSEEDIDALLEPVREELLSNLPPNFRQLVSENVVQKAVEKAELPLAQAAVFGMIPTEDGGCLVVNNYNTQTRRANGDIFDKNGTFLGTCELPPAEIGIFPSYNGYAAKAWFRNGKLYTIENEEGDYYLCRYKYRLHAK